MNFFTKYPQENLFRNITNNQKTQAFQEEPCQNSSQQTQMNYFGKKENKGFLVPKDFSNITKSQILINTINDGNNRNFQDSEPSQMAPENDQNHEETLVPPNTSCQSKIQEEQTPMTIEKPKLFNPLEWNLSRFEIGKPLGSGKFGHVYLAREIDSKFVVGLKVLCKKQLIEAELTANLVREIEIHSNLKHENIIKFYGYFWDERKIYLILEYAPMGALWDQMKKEPHGRFSEIRAANMIKQVAMALGYMHSMDVIHRDLKPENLLVYPNDVIKLSDFGWSVHTPSDKRKTFCGTPDYLCPEMVEGKTHDHRVDMWTLGVLTFELVTGRPPFESHDHHEQRIKIKKVMVNYPPYLSLEAKRFIDGLLQNDRNKRMTSAQILLHPWILRTNQ